jgi:DNA segregation ATPase FtsK/SpoIIIE, S-DNA-T family
MPETTINGHHRADDIPIQTSPVDFDPYTAPLDPATPPDAVPEQHSNPTLVADLRQADDLGSVPGDEQEQDQPHRYFHKVRSVAEHRHTRTVVRQGAYVAQGAVIAARRRRDARSTARHERMLALAESAGDHETALLWEARANKHRADRHARRMQLLHAPVHAAKASAYGAATAAGLLLVIGVCLAAAQHDPRQVAAPFMDAADVVKFVITMVSVLWPPAVLAGMFAGVAALWSTGRKRADVPTWLVTSAEGDDLVIDERTITLAIKALRIQGVNEYIKKGLPLQYLVPAREDGRGTYASLRLPHGVSAEKVAKRRTDLATGLHRAAKEVFPTVGTEAGILNLWIADKGRLEEGAGPYPLLTDGKADFFKGFPLGRTLRGDLISAPVNGRNTIVGGMPGQGKSSAARALMAGAALDPSCELRIWVPDANFDFEGFKARCSRYVMGAEDELIELIREDCELLHEEIQARGRVLIEHGEPEVTRKLADKEPRLRPLMTLLEEAHIAFNHAKHGKDIAALTIENVRLGRKRAVHQIVSTQAPTKDSIPRDVTRNCSNGLAFAVGDHVANDALLGQGAYRGGHRATELLPGVDRGVCLAKGITGERSDLIQVHFISITRDLDEITPLMQRAVQAANAQVFAAPERLEKRDLLADLDEVLGTEVTPIADVPRMLRQLAPAWPPYTKLTGTALVKQLAGHGIKVPSTGNKWPLDPAAVRRVLAERAEEGE